MAAILQSTSLHAFSFILILIWFKFVAHGQLQSIGSMAQTITYTG